MFLSFCYESKNKMVVSLVQSIHIFFSLSQVKKLVVRVVFALGEIEWMNMAHLCDRKIEEEQNRFDVMTRF